MESTKLQKARLFPITGIGGPGEEERRGTSVLLSVIRAVPEFGWALMSPMGAPKGRIETFTECEFQTPTKKSRPDGMIRITGKNKKVWTALVEVKTRKANLRLAQVDEYVGVAGANDFDAVLTISSQLSPYPGVHPLSIDKKKLKNVALHHRSWSEIHTEAAIEDNRRKVTDPDRALTLDEFLRYIESPKSGAFDFDDMGAWWVRTRAAAARNGLKANDQGLVEVVGRFAQLVSFCGMRQSQRLGVAVRPAPSGKNGEDSLERAIRSQAEFAKSGQLSGGLTIPGAVNPLRIVADLKSMRVECSVTVDSVSHGRATTRVKWLTRQIHNPPTDLSVEANIAWSRGAGERRRFSNVVDDPVVLIKDPKADIRSFTLSINRPVGTKRGVGKGSFIDSVLRIVDEFYEQVVQDLKPDIPTAPQVKRSAATETVMIPKLSQSAQSLNKATAVPASSVTTLNVSKEVDPDLIP